MRPCDRPPPPAGRRPPPRRLRGREGRSRRPLPPAFSEGRSGCPAPPTPYLARRWAVGPAPDLGEPPPLRRPPPPRPGAGKSRVPGAGEVHSRCGVPRTVWAAAAFLVTSDSLFVFRPSSFLSRFRTEPLRFHFCVKIVVGPEFFQTPTVHVVSGKLRGFESGFVLKRGVPLLYAVRAWLRFIQVCGSLDVR